MMQRILILLLISFSGFSQGVFSADSADLYPIFKSKSTTTSEIEKSNFSIEFSKKFGDWFDYQKKYKSLMVKNVDEWEMALYDVRNEQLKFLKEKSSSLNNYQIKRIENEIEFNYWHYIFAFPVLKSNADPKLKNVVSLPTIMTKSFKFDKNNLDSLFEVRSFRALIPFWVTYKNSEKRKFVKYADMIESAIDKADYAIDNLNGPILDFEIANLLKTNENYLSASSARYLISQIENPNVQNEFKGAFLDELITKENLAKKTKADADKKKKSAETPTIYSLDDKAFDFSKYDGKVVYVDFWASWCGPCRGQMPFSKQMHALFSSKEKSKIVFLYISIDDNEEAWKKAVEKLELKDFENGISKGGWNSELAKKYNITSIPRYMIIDKSGKIVKAEARRPSDPETILELKQLIK